MATIQDIKQRARQVRDATQIGENTANRVGGVLVDMADHLEQDKNQLSSLYPADATPTAGSTKPVQSGGIYEQLSQLLPMDEVPTPNSVKPVKSGGVFSKIRDISAVNIDASSLIGNWVVNGTAITFEGTGMNGTFTSHTNPNKPSTTRPYFRFTNFKVGAKYRLRLKGIVNSSRTDSFAFFYSTDQTTLWSSAKLIDIDGNEVICNNGCYLDCVFIAQDNKTYLGFSVNAYGIDDSITINDFSITEYRDISDLDTKFSEDIEGINEDISELNEKVYAEDIIPVRWVPGNNAGFSFSTEDGQNGTFTCIGSLSDNLTRPYIDMNNLENGVTYNLRFKMDMDSGNTSSKDFLTIKYDTPYSASGGSMANLTDIDGNNVVAYSGVEVNIAFVANSSKRYLTLITWGLNNGDKFTISNFSLFRKKSVQNINDELHEVTEIISQEDFSDYDELPLGDFKINTAGTIVYSSYIACIPYFGIKYKFKLPDGIMCQVKYGTNYNVVGDPDTWYVGGSTEEVARGTNDNYICQMVRFKKTDGSTVAIDTIKGYINSGYIKIYYARKDADIARRNYENEKYVKSAIYRLGLTSEERISISGVPSITTIVHVSDVHGDMKRFENAVEYADKLGAHAILSSGDNVMCYGPDGVGYMKDVIDRYPTIPFLNCVGNHEVIKRGSMSDIDNTYLFENFISKFKEQGGYKSTPSQVADMPYYYVDLVAQSLRIITINQFDGGYGGAYNAAGHLGQTQITWLCNTLLSTPENYGVVIMMHSAEDRTIIPEAFSAWHQSVHWSGGDADSQQTANGIYVSTERPIKHIVDAFISKTTIELTYTETNGGESVTVNADFSNVANGVEFICYVTGHRHTDNIGYVANTTNMQLMLNICSSNCHYPRQSYFSFAECEDIPRGDTGAVQDSFNVYGIDRQNGRVKIARVGSNVNFEGIERKFLIAAYKL